MMRSPSAAQRCRPVSARPSFSRSTQSRPSGFSRTSITPTSSSQAPIEGPSAVRSIRAPRATASLDMAALLPVVIIGGRAGLAQRIRSVRIGLRVTVVHLRVDFFGDLADEPAALGQPPPQRLDEGLIALRAL